MVICDNSPNLEEFYLLVISAQLLIGGVEQNPGPEDEIDNTLVSSSSNKSKSLIMEQNEVIITTLLQEIEKKTVEIAELKRRLRIQEHDRDNLENKMKGMKMEVDKQKGHPHNDLGQSSSGCEFIPESEVSSSLYTNRKREYSDGNLRSSSPVCDLIHQPVVATSLSSLSEKRRRDEFYDQSASGQRKYSL